MKQVNVIDTLIIYYTGLTANESKNYDDAITYFQKAADLKYKEPGLYNNLYKAYLAKGDSTKAFNSLKQGFAAYPENVGILIEIINYYLITNESQAALEYLEKAKKNDPGNKSFYFADGTLYDKIGNMDKAVESYKKAIELDPNYFDAYFNLAVVYFNNAVKLTEVANSELDNKKYLDKKTIADEEFKKVIPHMEKAYEIAKASPDGATNMRSALETLKTLYYRLKMTDQLDRVNKLLQDLK
jgi:tetratricopeptide (TPR) repeat protein